MKLTNQTPDLQAVTSWGPNCHLLYFLRGLVYYPELYIYIYFGIIYFISHEIRIPEPEPSYQVHVTGGFCFTSRNTSWNRSTMESSLAKRNVSPMKTMCLMRWAFFLRFLPTLLLKLTSKFKPPRNLAQLAVTPPKSEPTHPFSGVNCARWFQGSGKACRQPQHWTSKSFKQQRPSLLYS